MNASGAPRRRRATGLSGRRAQWVETSAVALITLLAAAWALQLWRADLSAPFRYAQLDDTKFYLMLIRSVIRHGWFEAGLSLGAPFGQHLADFPQGADNLNFLMIRSFALFSSNPALVGNLFFLATFPLAGASAFLVMRKLALGRAPALLGAVLFALLPYHFYRGESQLTLSAYYAVPLAAYLFLSIFLGEPRFERRPGSSGPGSWMSWRTGRTVVLCVVIASSGLYYAAFALVLLTAGAAVAALTGRGRGSVAGALGCVALVGLVLLANLSPSLIYRAEHGSNEQIARTLADTELLGLKPAQLLLPVQGHRLGPLSNLNHDYAKAASTGYCEQCYETLGTAGDVGFLWLLAGTLAAVVGAGGLLARSRLYGPAALGVLLSLLIASVGGLSSLFAYFLTPDVRGWNRMSLFIAFFSLLAAASLLQAGLSRLAKGKRGRRWPALVAGVVLVAGVLDQTSPDFVPGYRASAAEYRSDSAFFARVQSSLGAGAAVFELPYVPFPEGYGAATTALGFASPNFGTTYEELRGYITSSSLRWSYGAAKGRPADWAGELAEKPLSVALGAAALSGFDGLVIQPSGYRVAPALLMAALRAELGAAPLIDRRGELWFFDLRPYAARLRGRLALAQQQQVRDATLRPLRVSCSKAGMRVTGATAAAPAQLTIVLAGGEPLPSGLIVRFTDGSEQSLRPGSSTEIVHLMRLARQPGTVEFLSRTPLPGSFRVPVQSATLTAQAFGPLTSGHAAPILAGYPPPTCQVQPGHSPPATATAH